MAETESTIYYVGPGPDGLDIPLPNGTAVTAVRDGEGVKVPADTAKALLEREDFQKNKPTRREPRVETPEGKE